MFLVLGCSSKPDAGSREKPVESPALAATGSAAKPGALSPDACKAAAAAMLARTFTNALADDHARGEAASALEAKCAEDGWDARVASCINGVGDPWACIDVATARAFAMEPTPALTVHDGAEHACSAIWPLAPAWGVRGDEATTELVRGMLMTALTTACTRHGGWTDNAIKCFEKAATAAELEVCMRLIAKGDEVRASTAQVVERAAGWAKAAPLSCDAVVARFYSAEQLAKVTMPRFSAAERQRAIVEAQQALHKDCATWPEARRRCLAAARAHTEQLACIDNSAWEEVPSLISTLPTKVPACDVFHKAFKKCGNGSSPARGALESMTGVRATLFHAEPGSVQERDAIERCRQLAKELEAADCAS